MRISDWSSDVCSSDLELVDVDEIENILRHRGQGKASTHAPVIAPPPNPVKLRSGSPPQFRGPNRISDAPARQINAPPISHRSGSRPSTSHSRSEEHTSELQSLMRISYAVFCLKKKNTKLHKHKKTQ